jgi:rhodanese-related sulfurtransferase
MIALLSWSSRIALLALILVPAHGVAQAAPAAVGERVPVANGAYWNITVPQLQSMLEAKDFPLVNVHIPFQGDLPLTDASIPFDQITQHLDELPADKNAPVVLYCRSGRMSAEAAEVLAGMGYARVYNLVGGFNAWAAAGLPLSSTPVNP